ncbi:GFA family protein [Erythrobacter ani]|uniref:GFA family protein n=1 Tax=Erythrobacter ani TaxID=2827235 RepID=A0ABS6SM62_9SPHN|nr:GFA family protein [Erythrobacter ani]
MNSNNTTELHDGGCLCESVRYQVRGGLRGVVNCHCTMCQKLNGAIGAHTKAFKRDLFISNSDGLACYNSSDVARRGFCRRSGSSLFWDDLMYETIGILARSLDRK